MTVTLPDKWRPIPRLSRRHRAHRPHPRPAACIAVLALAFASPAMAQETIPPDNGGGDQYVPPVPDARGNRPSGPNSGNPGHLSPRVRRSLPSGVEGRVLARLATDPGSGAPTDVGSGGDESSSSGATSGTAAGGSGGNGGNGGGASGGGAVGGGDKAAKSASEAGATAASAITSAVSDNPSVVALVAALVALTLASAAVGLARRRRHS